MMQLYHGADDWLAALGICQHGFADRVESGVRLVDRADPLHGQTVLLVEVAAIEDELAVYEVDTGRRKYREWAVPASWLNPRAAARGVTPLPETKAKPTRRRASEATAASEDAATPKRTARPTTTRSNGKGQTSAEPVVAKAAPAAAQSRPAKKATGKARTTGDDQSAPKPRTRSRAARQEV